MKTLFLIIVGLISLNLYSQEKKIEYFNQNWEPTNDKRAKIHREIIKHNDTLYTLTDFYKKREIIMKGQYSSIDPMIENGYFEFFSFFNYKKTATGYYTNGVMTGDWVFINYDGKSKKVSYDLNLIYELKSANNKPESESVSECDSGYVIVDEMPRFQGRESTFFSDYIAQNTIYPPMAVKHLLAGKVILQFIINTSGKVTDITVLHSDNKDFEREAMRVVSESPEWAPGYHNGEAIRVRFTFPINFVII